MDSTDYVAWRLVQQIRPVITATRCNGKPSHTTQSSSNTCYSPAWDMSIPRTWAVRLEAAMVDNHVWSGAFSVVCLASDVCTMTSSGKPRMGLSPLEKPPVVQLLKNFPAFYGTRRFITVFTRAPTGLYCDSDQWIYTTIFYLSKIHFNIITHPCLGFPSALFLSGFPTNILLA
jgi:hypothetical protein